MIVIYISIDCLGVDPPQISKRRKNSQREILNGLQTTSDYLIFLLTIL